MHNVSTAAAIQRTLGVNLRLTAGILQITKAVKSQKTTLYWGFNRITPDYLSDTRCYGYISSQARNIDRQIIRAYDSRIVIGCGGSGWPIIKCLPYHF